MQLIPLMLKFEALKKTLAALRETRRDKADKGRLPFS
jgi:hypothetical protein